MRPELFALVMLSLLVGCEEDPAPAGTTAPPPASSQDPVEPRALHPDAGVVPAMDAAPAPTADAALTPDAAPPAPDAAVSRPDVAPPADDIVPSAKGRVRFKDGRRYAADLAAALDLPRDALCRELGTEDCVEVHRIVLGGVEPYRLGIREPLATAPLTAPIAVDRVALAACAERVKRDLEAPAEAVLLRGMDAVESPARWRRDVAGTIYDRVLRRDAEHHEIEQLAGFHAEVAAEHGGPSARATRDWAALSCFVVATSLEALFY